MLTELQLQIAAVVGKVPEAEQFALAGGAALIARGDIDRLTQHGPVGRTLAGEELAINKVLAVVGRAEARDFVDLSALTKRYGLEHLLRRAAEKDRSFDRDVFAEMLERFRRLPRDEFEVSDDDFEVLSRTVDHWRRILLERSPDRPEHDRGHDHGDDLRL